MSARSRIAQIAPSAHGRYSSGRPTPACCRHRSGAGSASPPLSESWGPRQPRGDLHAGSLSSAKEHAPISSRHAEAPSSHPTILLRREVRLCHQDNPHVRAPPRPAAPMRSRMMIQIDRAEPERRLNAPECVDTPSIAPACLFEKTLRVGADGLLRKGFPARPGFPSN